MAKKDLGKMTAQELKEYYEMRGLVIGLLFGLLLLAIAIGGFFVGFNGWII